MLCPAAYLMQSDARESIWEFLCTFDKGEWHSSLDWISYSQRSFLLPEGQETRFSIAFLPRHIHSCPPPSHFFCSVPYALLQESKSISSIVCVTHHRCVSLPGMQSACEILPEHSCTILPCFISCIFQEAPVPCDLYPFLFLCSRLKQSPCNPPFYL